MPCHLSRLLAHRGCFVLVLLVVDFVDGLSIGYFYMYLLFVQIVD